MKCIIIEDQPPAQRILKKYVDDIGSLVLKGVFNNAIDAMQFLKEEPVELIFLDIHLPKISGIDFLRAVPNPPAVILTTAFSDYALQSYEFAVVDYLLKPFSFQRFVKAVAKVGSKPIATKAPASGEGDSSFRNEVFIKSGHDHVKIRLDEVLYIKSDADYTEIKLPAKKHLSAEPLRYWLDVLNPDLFFRIHKSYIVNIDKVERIAGNLLYLVGQISIPIGRTYKDGFMKRYIK